jgi:D-glycero-alpha-D-manno-heptose-7-phosphate kinase
MSFIVCRAPYRVSFFGGGSDYPTWLDHEPGAVLSTAIDKYVYITCRYLPPFLGTKHRVVWRHVEQVDSIAEILHPAVREGLRFLKYDDSLGIELHYQGDLPSQSGMGSSSSFVVALMQALTCLRGPAVDQRSLAELAIDLEQKHMNETVGSQDQIAAAFGGMNVIMFRKGGSFDVHPILLPAARQREFFSRLMLFFPGRKRLSSGIAEKVVKNLHDRSSNIRRMVAMVGEGTDILRHGNLDDFGLLLHEAWELKRSLADAVSSDEIDELYRRGREAGAIGGKLLGAGGAGFFLLYVPLEKQEAVRNVLTPQCIHVPFAMDNEGATVIYKAADLKVPE